jgi:hypothetical protein
MDGSKAFRVPWALQMIPAIVLAIGLVFLPESPRWLARKDRWEETQAVLTSVHGKGDPNSPFVTLEMQEIRQMIEFERQNADVSVKELFHPRMLNRLHIGVFTQIWSQLVSRVAQNIGTLIACRIDALNSFDYLILLYLVCTSHFLAPVPCADRILSISFTLQ